MSLRAPMVWFTTHTGGQLGTNAANLRAFEVNSKIGLAVHFRTGGKYKLDPNTIEEVRAKFDAERRRRENILRQAELAAK